MHVLGDYNSPVIPALIYVPAKISAFSMECYDRGLAVSLSHLFACCLCNASYRVCDMLVRHAFCRLLSSTKA